MSPHLRKKKIHFVAATLVLVFLITGGIDLFKGKDIWSLLDHFKYLTIRAAYAKSNGSGEIASVATALGGVPKSVGETETADAVPVLLYHGIVKKADRFAVTEETFRDQMFALKRAGYVTITVADFEAFMRGEKTLPKKAFLLTFDDGRLDSYLGADPILQAIGFHAVMNVAVDDSMPGDWKKRQTFYITKADIQRMTASGRWEVGSHAMQLTADFTPAGKVTAGFVPLDAAGTNGNFLSNRAWIQGQQRLETEQEYEQRLDHELTDAKRILSETVGSEVRSFAYPFGDYGQQTVNEPGAVAAVRAVISKDYAMAFRQVWLNDGFFAYNRPGDDMYDLKRIETPTDWSGAQLVEYLAQGETKVLPYQDDFSVNRGWMLVWGNQDLGSDGLTLSSDASSTGATSMLEGSHAWSDYSVDATVERLKNGYISLASRYQDTGDHVSCVFGGGWIRIDRSAGGVTTHLSETRMRGELPQIADIGMRVRGAQAECDLNGKSAVTAAIPAGAGGLAVKVWDPLPDNTEFRLKQMTVQPFAP